jgi:hypothetical protein
VQRRPLESRRDGADTFDATREQAAAGEVQGMLAPGREDDAVELAERCEDRGLVERPESTARLRRTHRVEETVAVDGVRASVAVDLVVREGRT